MTTVNDTWKVIENFENYEISNKGIIRNIHTQKFRKQQIHENGYFFVQLWKNNKPKNILIHRLLALAFVENPSNLKEINHIDRNPQNNRIENLRFATSSQNKTNTNMYSNNKSGIKGVSWHKNAKKFRAQIKINNKSYNLGLYDSEFEAGFVYEFFSLMLFKEFSKITRKFNKFYTPKLFEKINKIIKHYNF
jgi:NUMOD4 motif/HNH endonuclease/AP2 domain